MNCAYDYLDNMGFPKASKFFSVKFAVYVQRANIFHLCLCLSFSFTLYIFTPNSHRQMMALLSLDLLKVSSHSEVFLASRTLLVLVLGFSDCANHFEASFGCDLMLSK